MNGSRSAVRWGVFWGPIYEEKKRSLLTGWPRSAPKVLNRHFQEMFGAILVGAFERLHRAEKREYLFNGEQGGFVIGFRRGCDVDRFLRIDCSGTSLTVGAQAMEVAVKAWLRKYEAGNRE